MAIPSAPEVRSRGADLSGITGRDVLNVQPNHPFWLVHWKGRPGSWDVADIDGKPVWLPVLNAYPIVEGANGVRTLGKGESPSKRIENALVKLQTEGAILVEPGVPVDGAVLPPGVDVGPGYLRETDCRGGKFYHHAWDIPRNPLPGRPRVPNVDRERFDRWRLSLVTSGVIPLPDPQVIEDAKANAAQRVQSALADTVAADKEQREQRVSKQRARAERLAAAVLPGSGPAAKAKPARGVA